VEQVRDSYSAEFKSRKFPLKPSAACEIPDYNRFKRLIRERLA
jgi:hypothetical protein